MRARASTASASATEVALGDGTFDEGRCHGYHHGVMGQWQHGDGQRDVTLQRIVAAPRPWDPERIILFGSHARGDAHPDSDLDILVILPDAQAVTRRTVVDMRLAIGAVPVDYDLLITSHADFEWRRDYVGTIEYPAAHEGVELDAA